MKSLLLAWVIHAIGVVHNHYVDQRTRQLAA